MLKVTSTIRPWSRVEWHKHLARTYEDQFLQTFGLPLGYYMNLLLGFNIVAFDAAINTPATKSVKDHIKATYGQEAVDLIIKLMSSPPPPPVDTETNMAYDIAAQTNTAGFKRCEFTYITPKGETVTLKGYYKGGLIVTNHYGSWQICTKDGVCVTTAPSCKAAKTVVAQLLPAMDWEKANTLRFTADQYKAADRVAKHWRHNGLSIYGG